MLSLKIEMSYEFVTELFGFFSFLLYNLQTIQDHNLIKDIWLGTWSLA